MLLGRAIHVLSVADTMVASKYPETDSLAAAL
jgi:hypothetical protein